ncbi:MAG: carcinine hydrolase/isopenicillin-N N-acyltransferase family protein [Clostridia bacterium]|nr:carcinine hydrolase/isopenicillin-N N-acyltransferase family protein [Clostridia bacterium]
MVIYKRIVSSGIIIALLLSFNIQVSACTIFEKQQGDQVLVGNNEDWVYSMPSNMWLVAPEEDSYGRVCFALSSYVQGGMNEKGLFYDGATCPASKVPFKKGNTLLGMDFGEVVLSKCTNVQEAIEMVKKINIPGNFSDHIFFADETGNTAVVEWVENEMRIIPKEGNYQIATNFWLSNQKLGGYPCKRFDKAKEMLEDQKDISVTYFADILKATSQDWGDGGTKYSNVYDLRNKEVYIYQKGDFEKSAKCNLTEDIKKLGTGGKRVYKLEELSYQKEKSPNHKADVKAGDEKKQAKADTAMAIATASAEQKALSTTMNADNNSFDTRMFIMVLILFFTVTTLMFIVFKRRQRKE